MSLTRITPAILRRAQEITVPALQEAVSRLSPWLRQPVGYHLGWTDAEGSPTPGSGGKGVRAALCVLSAQGAGAAQEVGVPAAVAVELVHNFSLLHDDIIDGDRERRHRETVWSLWGVGQAIIAGDALLSLAHEILIEAPSLAAFDAARRLASATSAMISGQAEDMAAEGCASISLEACEQMERGKTGALLGAAACLGAVLAEADPAQVGCLERFGVDLGLAFQATDDLLGIWGDPSVTGKPAWSDLRQAKASLPVAAALASGEKAGMDLAELLGDFPLADHDLPRAARLVEEAGGRRYAAAAAASHLESALAALEESNVTPASKAELVELANFVVDRAY